MALLPIVFYWKLAFCPLVFSELFSKVQLPLPGSVVHDLSFMFVRFYI